MKNIHKILNKKIFILLIIFSWSALSYSQEQTYRGIVICVGGYSFCTCQRVLFHPDSGYSQLYLMSAQYDMCEYDGKYVEITGSVVPCDDPECVPGLLLLASNVIDLPFGSMEFNLEVEAGWNMISVPLQVKDYRYKSLFPDAASEPFDFKEHYNSITRLENGQGYFMKFESTQTFVLRGEPIHNDTINVLAGWNMIGSISYPVGVNTIRSVPEGIILSDIYKHIVGDGYESIDTIYPGKGYWVKVRENGSIILNYYAPSNDARDHFLLDATDFAVDKLFATSSPDTDNIFVPDTLLNEYLNPLTCLYNSRDSIPLLENLINQKRIHKQLIQSYSLAFKVDTTYEWVQNIKNKISPTGNHTIDSLIELCSLEFALPHYWWAYTWITTRQPPLNIPALGNVFLAVPGVLDAEPNALYSFYTKLDVIPSADFTTVIFYYGYGDCESGCLGYEQWTFTVSSDYKVTYKGYHP
jgi:hypothetical protein